MAKESHAEQNNINKVRYNFIVLYLYFMEPQMGQVRATTFLSRPSLGRQSQSRIPAMTTSEMAHYKTTAGI